MFGLLSRVYIVFHDNIFFTVDQGRDAVYVREILNSHKIFLKGPETSVRGLFTGPLWYYFIAIGYFITQRHPSGSVLMLVILNLITTFVLMIVIKKAVGMKIALITGFGLLIFWPFFVTSLYGFNPFPLVALSIIFILLLIKNKYELSLIPILFAFNTELAGAIVFLLFYILIGSYLVLYKKLTRKKFFVFSLGIPFIGLFKLAFDFLKQDKVTTNSGLKIFSATNFINITLEFIKMGWWIFIFLLLVYLFKKQKNLFIKKFTYLSFILVLISYFFFASNMGWREWHTVYIPTLILISSILICYELKYIGKLLIVIILIYNAVNFRNSYLNYLVPSDNPGLLYNQEKTLDWIYTHNEENGFNLYTYTNSYYDYNYQYLMSWYAKTKYGFYPCEYSNYPLSHKYLYIPGAEKYNEPKLGCDKLRFLIIESNTNGNENKNWINEFKTQTELTEKVIIGSTAIEKRKTPDIY